jgi:hypothetical protein
MIHTESRMIASLAHTGEGLRLEFSDLNTLHHLALTKERLVQGTNNASSWRVAQFTR